MNLRSMWIRRLAIGSAAALLPAAIVLATHAAAATPAAAPGCAQTTQGGSWQNTAFANQTGTFTAQFDATPSAADMNGVVGLSNGSQTAYTGFAAIARFNPSGDIDARNGKAYAAASTIHYQAGVTYHFRMAVSISSHTYSIFVTAPGGAEQTVGSNFAFRSEQSGVSQLNWWGAFSEVGTEQVCGFTLGTGPTPSPTATPSNSPSTSPSPTPSQGGCSHSGPVPGQPPGCNFNLSIWELQLPTGQPGNPTTISNSQLEAGFTDQFFFTGSDGAMDFVDPGTNCVTTPNSSHCRTELREVNTNGSAAVWSASGTNTLSATLKVTNAAGAPVIGQIHDDPAKSVRPLIELFYTTSGDISAGVEQCLAGGCETRTTVGHVAVGTEFSYVINYSHNQLSVSIDGGPPHSLSSPILGVGGYFKAGDYGQSPANASVSFYALNVTHGP
jgi:Alginate lyase